MVSEQRKAQIQQEQKALLKSYKSKNKITSRRTIQDRWQADRRLAEREEIKIYGHVLSKDERQQEIQKRIAELQLN